MISRLFNSDGLGSGPAVRTGVALARCPGGVTPAWIRLGLVLAGLGGSLTARAELQWTDRRIVLTPPAGAAEATGEFEFVNRGTTPVRFTDVLSSCGCTVMALEKSTIEPGEKGKIQAVVHLESRQGRQSVPVAVTTQEPEEHRYELTVEVEIKDFVLISPQLISWKLGDDPNGKVFHVILVAGFRFLAAESSTQDFSVEVAGQTEAAVQLRVTPRDTWAKRSGVIKVKVAPESGSPAEVLANVRVL